MTQTVSRPTIFVGSSTPALSIAKEIQMGLKDMADVVVWDTAFDAGTWLLGGILKQAQQSDFAVFVIRTDDWTRIGKTQYMTVRDNVLFEAGIFMGTLGPDRTFLLWPSGKGSEKLRLPTDLEGLLRLTYTPQSSLTTKPDLQAALLTIQKRIVAMGPALRSGYNEIAKLRQALNERDIEFSDGTYEALGKIVQRAAKRRKGPWFSATRVTMLTRSMEEHYRPNVVDLVFWWLIVYGVITFDNIDEWTSDGSWYYEDSVEYTQFSERGLVLLNEMRAAPMQK